MCVDETHTQPWMTDSTKGRENGVWCRGASNNHFHDTMHCISTD